MKKLEEFRWTEHRPRFGRRTLGRAPISGRPLYAASVTCQCGWSLNWNESKAETEKAWKQHSREEWNKARLK